MRSFQNLVTAEVSRHKYGKFSADSYPIPFCKNLSGVRLRVFPVARHFQSHPQADGKAATKEHRQRLENISTLRSRPFAALICAT